MGRPIGSANRERPFNSALLIELRSNPLTLFRCQSAPASSVNKQSDQ